MKDNYDLKELISKKKTRINSNKKGGRFERKILKILNTRFNTTEFCRTPGSGAFATTHNLPDHLKLFGDLITPKNFRFIFELKSGYSKEGICNLFNPKSTIRKMIDQSDRDSKKSGKESLLVLGQDRTDCIVFIKSSNLNVYSSLLTFTINVNNEYIVCKLSELLSFPDNFFFT